ncbi:hypothetical protein RHGRI_032172 [Rhododendron griersonianum]|uniref:ATP-dependent RNA helicase DHX29-like UBA domain-containing protein n=1 Tax=Rhododendron griersonianum TaxID=479676 RepID=A0AAV6IAQ2_9ERIC|nr:hypothetical protein RHGRI_032172 [Rhododendron griersonianum]
MSSFHKSKLKLQTDMIMIYESTTKRSKNACTYAKRCFVERCQPKDTTSSSVAFHRSYPLSASCSDGYPGQHRSKVAELSTFGRLAKLRSSSWWIRYLQTSLEENEAATKKFEQAATKRSYKPACQDGASLEAALDWLCLNLPGNELPLKFSTGTSLYTIEGGAVGIISTSRKDWGPSVDSSAKIEEETPELNVRIKGH